MHGSEMLVEAREGPAKEHKEVVLKGPATSCKTRIRGDQKEGSLTKETRPGRIEGAHKELLGGVTTRSLQK